jgi:DNA invertase Pin-like site-specific DNA recombinase
MQPTAWLYLVVSTSRQAETLGEQEAWATAAANAHGWAITRTFQGTASGRTGPRKLIQDLLQQLRTTHTAQRPARVLMTRLDRVGRGDTLQILVAIDEIMRLGATIHTREDGDVIIRTSSDIIKPFFRALTGGLENEARADKARAGHARRKSAGLHDGHAPYGVVLIEGRPRPFEPAATIVRTIFKLRAQGLGLRTIRKRILEQHPPPKSLSTGGPRQYRGTNRQSR